MKEPELKISREKLDRFVKVEDIDILGYESPITMITKRLAEDIAKKTDDTILQAVVNAEVIVNKEELVKALEFDRGQYTKGYHQGYKVGYESAFNRMPWWAKKILIRRLRDGKR